MTLLGWTAAQWALAAFWYLEAAGALPLPGVTGAREVWRRWHLAHAYAPGESPLMLPWQRRKPVPEWTWAVQTMYLAALEAGPAAVFK